MGLWQIIRRLLGQDDPAPVSSFRAPAVASPAASTTARFGLNELARRLELGIDELRMIQPQYHEFQIRKRRGGMRQVSAPSGELKMIQRRILHRLLGRLRAHEAACGFERGQSIVTNAHPHCRSAVVIKMDIRDFFHSTSAERVRHYFGVIGWDDQAADLLTRLCTHQGHLPQGAPTSPRLSNLVNHRLDARLSALAIKFGGRYTRYADDMTFSLPREDREAQQAIIRITKHACREEGYTLHQDRKLQIRRRAYERQQVTGLVVNEQVNLPRHTRRWLRAVEHHIASGQQCTLTADQLAGWHALRQMVEQQRLETQS